MRHKYDLQLPHAYFNRHWKGVYYTGNKLNNALPRNIKNLNYDDDDDDGLFGGSELD